MITQELYAACSKSLLVTLQEHREGGVGDLRAELGNVLARHLIAARAITNDEPITEADKNFLAGCLNQWDEMSAGFFLAAGATKELDQEQVDRAVVMGLAAVKTVAEFRRRLQDALNQYVKSGNKASFISSFARSIDVQLTKAWNEGAASVNVKPEEMTERDLKELGKIIDSENQHILRVGNEIASDQQEEMEPEKFDRKWQARIDLWANRYPDTVNRARVWFGKKTRLIWKYGDRKHCSTCKALNGKIAFAEEWKKLGVAPQSPPNGYLDCEGWNCGCTLVPTTKRRTANAAKKIAAIVGK